jgi:hypothetical protein
MCAPAALLACAALVTAGACHRAEPPAAPAATTPAGSRAEGGPFDLLAAAEPFEAIAGTAFTARYPELDPLIAKAVATAERVKPLLPPDARQELGTRLDEIAAARRVDDRPGIALAAAEVYRILVSHAPHAPVPTEVALLDYAGLRYGADLKARPIRWGDMTEAVAYARRIWGAIERRVGDKPLHDGFARALADMGAAVQRRDAAAAADAVKREMDLVDMLETWFGQAGK